MTTNETTNDAGCTVELFDKDGVSTGVCGRPIQAKGLCQAHYRRHLRKKKNGGSNAHVDAPIRMRRGDLKPLSLRVTKETERELERAGGAYRIGSEVLEAWAADHAQTQREIDAARGPNAPKRKVAKSR